MVAGMMTCLFLMHKQLMILYILIFCFYARNGLSFRIVFVSCAVCAHVELLTDNLNHSFQNFKLRLNFFCLTAGKSHSLLGAPLLNKKGPPTSRKRFKKELIKYLKSHQGLSYFNFVARYHGLLKRNFVSKILNYPEFPYLVEFPSASSFTAL